MSIVIRKALPKDSKVLFGLSIDFTEYNSTKSGHRHKFFPDGWEEFFKKEVDDSITDPVGIVFISEVDSVPVGFIYAYYCEKCWYTCISDLYVKDSHRGLGLGKSLLEEAEKWCANFDAPLRIEVYPWNKDAIYFYEKRGYKLDSYVLEKP